ncbi:MAG: hypothetical protein LKG53_09950, partial [Lachnospiraceae bacterium]|nr:hypothetical protein [Lachnospiraceae bacterium]
SVFSVSFPFSIRILFHIILNDKTGSKDLSQSLFVYSLRRAAAYAAARPTDDSAKEFICF